jgi:hypothetical protein
MEHRQNILRSEDAELGFKRRGEDMHDRGVCAWPIETFDNPQLVRIGPNYENDRDC